jgi:Tfp pilus assembly protein PilZ
LARLKLHLVDRSDFLKFHDLNVSGGGLFIPGSEPHSVGDPVIVEVIFQGGPHVLLHGKVQWRRTTGDARTRPGVGVGIDPNERAKLDFVIGYVRGGLMDVRVKRRLPLRLRVTYSGPHGRRINFTRDLNEEGAFVRAVELLEVGSTTVLLISPPGGEYKPIEVHATVARQETDGPDRGMGVRFIFQKEEERNRFIAFVNKLESDYLSGRLPDDVLL